MPSEEVNLSASAIETDSFLLPKSHPLSDSWRTKCQEGGLLEQLLRMAFNTAESQGTVGGHRKNAECADTITDRGW